MYKKLNYAIGDVASTTAIDATTLTLKAGHTITTDTGETNKFVAVFYDGTKSSPYQDTNREIVEAYRTNTNDFVISRAKESTSAKEWVENDKFMLIASAGVFNEYETELDGKQDSLGYTPENVANRLAAFQETPDDNHYISEKLAYNQLALKANLISPSFTTPNIGSATGTSLDLEGTTLGILSLKNTTPTAYTRMLFDGTGTDFTQGVGNASAAIADLQNKFYIYDFTNSKTAFTITPDTLAAKFYGSLEATNLSGTNTGDEVAASSAEINTGTDNDKYITPNSLAGSNAFTKTVQQYCVEWGTELAVEDGVGYIEIPAECNGMNLISARARVGTPGVTGKTTFDIFNVTDGVSMLSSAITIASGVTSGTGTVDTAHDDVATGDIIRIDCDGISTTPPKGLIVTLSFRLI